MYAGVDKREAEAAASAFLYILYGKILHIVYFGFDITMSRLKNINKMPAKRVSFRRHLQGCRMGFGLNILMKFWCVD